MACDAVYHVERDMVCNRLDIAMGKLNKGRRHHWWPKSLSRFWANEDDEVGCLFPDGTVRFANHAQWGVLKDAHNIKLAPDSPWNSTFEGDFDAADGSFPKVVEWVSDLVEAHGSAKTIPNKSAYRWHEDDQPRLIALSECIASLAVRSPSFRSGFETLAESFGGAKTKQKKHVIASANLAHKQTRVARSIQGRGKFVLIFTRASEFCFGDGFYANTHSMDVSGMGGRMLVPLTPQIALLFTQPSTYTAVPKVMTKEAKPAEVDAINYVTSVYAKKHLFFQHRTPPLVTEYEEAEHLRFKHEDPVQEWTFDIPGVRKPEGWDALRNLLSKRRP